MGSGSLVFASEPLLVIPCGVARLGMVFFNQVLIARARGRSYLLGNAVMVAPLGGEGDPRLLVHSEAAAEYASGHLLFVRDETLMAQPFDPVAAALSGEPVPLAEREKAVRESDIVITVTGASQDELHVQDQTVTRRVRGKRARGIDRVLITDQNNQPVGGVTVTAAYYGPTKAS